MRKPIIFYISLSEFLHFYSEIIIFISAGEDTRIMKNGE